MSKKPVHKTTKRVVTKPPAKAKKPSAGPVPVTDVAPTPKNPAVEGLEALIAGRAQRNPRLRARDDQKARRLALQQEVSDQLRQSEDA